MKNNAAAKNISADKDRELGRLLGHLLKTLRGAQACQPKFAEAIE